jgi:hypothetical protein
MALYLAKIKGTKDTCNYYAYPATSIEEAMSKAIKQLGKAEIENIKFLFSEDEPEGAIKKIQRELDGLFLELHHLGYAGYVVSNHLTNGNDTHKASAQWEIRAVMDAIKEKSEQIYGLLDTLMAITEDRILEGN